jgi:N-acetylneuraminic acid mutarotase
MGGYDGSVHNDVYYAPINANGTLGNWVSTNSFTTTRSALGGFAYNGYLYIMGGYDGSSTYYSDVQYAKINSDGTVGSWMTTTSFSTARAGAVTAAYNGYAYVVGGTTNTTTSRTDVQYAQINANGTLGTWRTSSTLGTGVWGAGGAAYSGYLYVVNGHTTTGSSYTTSVQYAKIDRPGTTTAWTTSGNTFTTARALSCSVAYNGYLYNLGGSTVDGMGNNVTTVQYAAIAADGTIGSWASTTALPEARGSFGCVAYNGRLYIVGGYTGTSTTGTALATTRYISINSNGTLAASWTNGTALSETVSDNVNAFTYTTPDGTTRLYLGGSRGNSSIDVMYSTINASTGALGTFSLTSSPTDVATGLNQGRFALVGNHMYYYGTENGSQVFTNQVWYSTIASNGTLSTWQTTANLPSALAWTSSVTVNGCIYAIGGWNSTGNATVKTVYFACPNADGTISSWYSAPDLAVATEDMGVASFNGAIYAVGGYTTAVVNTVKYAFVNNGGSGAALGNWGYTGTTLSGAREDGSAIAYNNYLYAVGGDRTWIEYAPINPDGSTGSWTVDNSHNLSTERRSAGVAAYNGYMYILGGNVSGGEYFKSILYAPIASNGALGAAWASAGGDVSNGGQGVNLVAYNGYLYSIGGWDGTTDHNMVQYAAINANGTIGSWQTTASFDTGRSNAASFAYGGYIYILGGNGGTNYNTVQYAPINGDGSLGTWRYTSPFVTARVDATVAAYNGFIYLAGGWDNSNRTGYGDTQYAPINADGTVGPWQQALKTVAPSGTSYIPAGKRASSAQSVYNGYLYGVAGDMYGSTDTDTAMVLPLNSIARKAQYSKLIALGSPAASVTVNYNGSSNPGGTTLRFMTAGSNGVFGSLTNGTAGAGVDPGMICGTSSITSVWVQATIDDSGRATFGGGTPSNITDITAYYGLSARPQPNQRLHGGKFFSSQTLQPLDTCGNM